MSPQDAETIRDVFAKIRSMGTDVDDAAAARLVEQELRANPAAALNLIRVVVGLEQERDQFAAHIGELDRYIDGLEARLNEVQQAPGATGGSVFGGGIRGSAWSREAAATPAAAPAQVSPWSTPEPAQPSRWASPGPTSGPWGQPAAQPQGGGFWGSALRTGAGVAGGLLAVEAVKGLFGGGHGAEARDHERHGIFDREARSEEPRGAPEEARSGGFGGEAHEREPFVADNIDFFGGSDDDGTA